MANGVITIEQELKEEEEKRFEKLKADLKALQMPGEFDEPITDERAIDPAAKEKAAEIAKAERWWRKEATPKQKKAYDKARFEEEKAKKDLRQSEKRQRKSEKEVAAFAAETEENRIKAEISAKERQQIIAKTGEEFPRGKWWQHLLGVGTMGVGTIAMGLPGKEQRYQDALTSRLATFEAEQKLDRETQANLERAVSSTRTTGAGANVKDWGTESERSVSSKVLGDYGTMMYNLPPDWGSQWGVPTGPPRAKLQWMSQLANIVNSGPSSQRVGGRRKRKGAATTVNPLHAEALNRMKTLERVLGHELKQWDDGQTRGMEAAIQAAETQGMKMLSLTDLTEYEEADKPTRRYMKAAYEKQSWLASQADLKKTDEASKTLVDAMFRIENLRATAWGTDPDKDINKFEVNPKLTELDPSRAALVNRTVDAARLTSVAKTHTQRKSELDKLADDGVIANGQRAFMANLELKEGAKPSANPYVEKTQKKNYELWAKGHNIQALAHSEKVEERGHARETLVEKREHANKLLLEGRDYDKLTRDEKRKYDENIDAERAKAQIAHAEKVRDELRKHQENIKNDTRAYNEKVKDADTTDDRAHKAKLLREAQALAKSIRDENRKLDEIQRTKEAIERATAVKAFKQGQHAVYTGAAHTFPADSLFALNWEAGMAEENAQFDSAVEGAKEAAKARFEQSKENAEVAFSSEIKRLYKETHKADISDEELSTNLTNVTVAAAALNELYELSYQQGEYEGLFIRANDDLIKRATDDGETLPDYKRTSLEDPPDFWTNPVALDTKIKRAYGANDDALKALQTDSPDVPYTYASEYNTTTGRFRFRTWYPKPGVEHWMRPSKIYLDSNGQKTDPNQKVYGGFTPDQWIQKAETGLVISAQLGKGGRPIRSFVGTDLKDWVGEDGEIRQLVIPLSSKDDPREDVDVEKIKRGPPVPVVGEPGVKPEEPIDPNLGPNATLIEKPEGVAKLFDAQTGRVTFMVGGKIINPKVNEPFTDEASGKKWVIKFGEDGKPYILPFK